MILTDRPTVWRLSFDYEEIFKLSSLQTSYDESRQPEGGDITNSRVLLDEDKPLFRYYLAIAISELTGYLARRLDSELVIKDDQGEIITNNGLVETDTQVTYYLVMSLNHESHLIGSLYRYCMEYLKRRVLEQWYNTSLNNDEMRLKIHQVLEYRKKPITRPINGLF